MPKNDSMFIDRNTLSVTPEVAFGTMPNRIFAEVQNLDAAITVYVGKDSTVDAATGYPVRPGAAFSWEDYTGPIWAVAASGTPVVALITW